MSSGQDYFTVTCPACAKQLRAPASTAGRVGKCNGCGTKVALPKTPTAKTPIANVPAAKTPTAKTSTANIPAAKTRVSPETPTIEPASLEELLGEVGNASSACLDLGGTLSELIEEGNAQLAERIANRLTVEEVTGAIRQNLPRRSVSSAYRLHLFLVAFAMATLPVIYVAFVASVGFGLFYYVAYLIPPLMNNAPGGRAALFYAIGVLSPAVVGFILVLFMIKPLFFRIRDDHRRRSLSRQAQPLLFGLVDRICEATGAPKPTRIDVDYQVNASAQPEGGLLSIATGRMVLTIGIPLLAGLSSRELAGVLAHEFGHFSQRIGMGTSLIIRKVNLWFARVVYQRDTLDEMLDSAIQESDWRIAIILQLAKVCVVFSRGVLWCFMMLGHGISAGLMRQMEFDADRYEYGLVGSRTFADTSLELQLLGASQAAALERLLHYFQHGRLADDMILLTQHFRAQLPSQIQSKIRAAAEAEAGGWLDTHPTNRARIARAQAADQPGCFQLERPARELLRHYEAICQGVTWDFYRDQLGSHISPQQLTPTTQLLQGDG